MALSAALSQADLVIPAFILDPSLLTLYAGSKRLGFLFSGLHQLDADLRARGSRLIVRQGEPAQALARLVSQSGAEAVFAEEDFSPYARRRDAQVAEVLVLHLAGSPVLRPPGTVLKAESLGENRCIEAATANAVALDCALTEDSFHFRLQVSPPGAPLSVELTMDDEPLDPYNLYLGRFGLALLDKTELETSDDFRLAYSSRAPHFVEGFDPGVFVWHSSPQAAMGSGVPLGLGPEELEFEGEESITDHAARKFLKDLGYWQ